MYNNLNLFYPNYNRINESRSLIEGNTEWILSLNSIQFRNLEGKIVEVPCREFTKIVDMALGRIESRFPYISPYIMHSKIMYVPYEGGLHDTMCVDTGKNLWINMPFVYNHLDMDVDKVYGILFHELMHNFLGHLKKMEEKFPIVKRMALGEAGWDLEMKKCNVCTDMEVNCDMVADEVVTAGFWEKMQGVYEKEYTGMMWEQIYASHGGELFAKYSGGGEVGEKTAAVLKAFEEYAEKMSDPDASERDKARAKEELKKKLEEILGKDPSDKKDKTKTIRDALVRLRASYLKDIADFKDILDELIDIYLINPEKFDGSDLDRALTAIEKLEKALNDNLSDIVSESMHLEETSFREYVKNCMDTFRGNTVKVYEGRTTLPEDEIAELNNETAQRLWNLLEDDETKEKMEKKMEKDKETKEKKKAEEKAKKEKKEKAEKRKRHPLFELFKKLANISNLAAINRISDETCNITADIAKGLQTMFDTPIDEIKPEDMKPFIDKCEPMGELLKKDLIELYDEHIITTKTTAELNTAAETAATATKNALEKVVDASADLPAKREAIVKALGALNEVGKLLRTKKITKPSDEFKKAYKEEMERLTKVAKEMGKDAIKDHLSDMGFDPDNNFDGTDADVTGTSLDPFKHKPGTVKKETPAEKPDEDKGKSASFRDYDDIEAFEGTIYYEITKFDKDDDYYIILLSNNPDKLSDDWDVYSTIAKKFEIDFPEYTLSEESESVFDILNSSDETVVNDTTELEKKLKSKTDYKKSSWLSKE